MSMLSVPSNMSAGLLLQILQLKRSPSWIAQKYGTTRIKTARRFTDLRLPTEHHRNQKAAMHFALLP
jgi:hypothetical protein